MAGVLDEVLAGQALSLAQVARKFPGRSKGNVDPATVYRWSTHGVECRGQRVKLETCRVGRRLLTSEPALERFLAALQCEPVQPSTATSATGKRRAEELAQTAEELQKLGL